jgi:shikimate kinase
MCSDIILIGPIGVGKSTIGALLARKLGVSRVSLDEVRFKYYRQIGYDEMLAERIGREQGFRALYSYWKPFEAYAVERVLAEFSDCVIDFGAGHSVYEDEALFARVRHALQPYANVVLLLPCANLDESVRILRARHGEYTSHGMDFHEHFVKHSFNHALAKVVVYTNEKTPAEACDEILKKTNRRLT